MSRAVGLFDVGDGHVGRLSGRQEPDQVIDLPVVIPAEVSVIDAFVPAEQPVTVPAGVDPRRAECRIRVHQPGHEHRPLVRPAQVGPVVEGDAVLGAADAIEDRGVVREAVGPRVFDRTCAKAPGAVVAGLPRASGQFAEIRQIGVDDHIRTGTVPHHEKPHRAFPLPATHRPAVITTAARIPILISFSI